MLQAAIWFRADGFLSNENKTQQMFFSLKNIPMDDYVSNVK